MGLDRRDDLHAESDDERGECPRSVTQCLSGQNHIQPEGKGDRCCALTKKAIVNDYDEVGVKDDSS